MVVAGEINETFIAQSIEPLQTLRCCHFSEREQMAVLGIALVEGTGLGNFQQTGSEFISLPMWYCSHDHARHLDSPGRLSLCVQRYGPCARGVNTAGAAWEFGVLIFPTNHPTCYLCVSRWPRGASPARRPWSAVRPLQNVAAQRCARSECFQCVFRMQTKPAGMRAHQRTAFGACSKRVQPRHRSARWRHLRPDPGCGARGHPANRPAPFCFHDQVLQLLVTVEI